jgi:CRP-like cAMP-binding protein
MSEPDKYRNQILSRISADDMAQLAPHLEPVDLPVRRRLSQADRTIEAVFFIARGVASTTATVRHETPIEIGITGHEGMANVTALMGMDRATTDTFMQVGGTGFSIAPERMLDAMGRSPALIRLVMLGACLVISQTASTAVANGRATVTERLARWLLMVQDRVDSDMVVLTHEFLSIMLGVRRAGVTVALSDLRRSGLVSGKRGVVEIIDRKCLIAVANGYYGRAETEAQRLFDQKASAP